MTPHEVFEGDTRARSTLAVLERHPPPARGAEEHVARIGGPAVVRKLLTPYQRELGPVETIRQTYLANLAEGQRAIRPDSIEPLWWRKALGPLINTGFFTADHIRTSQPGPFVSRKAPNRRNGKFI